MREMQAGRSQLLLFAPIVLLTIGLLLAACRPAAPIPLTGAQAGMASAPLPVVGDVRAEYMAVSIAPPGAASFARLPDGRWYQLLAGSLIATDDLGEAWLQLRTCKTLVYVFHNSGLVTSACSKAEQASGNVTCSTQGTAAFRDECASRVVIQTLGAEVTLEGTWLTVTYLPDRRLTVVLVFDGEAAVQPVRNVDEREDAPRDLGDPVTVGARHFWFSTPGESADPIGGLAARESHPFDRLPVVMQELGLERWMEKILERARMDNVLGDPPAFSPTPTISVTPTPNPTPTATATPTPEPARLCTVVSRALNLRNGPGTDYLLIGSLPRGAALQALARNSDERWIVIEVQGSGQQGWVFAGSGYITCDFPIASLPAATPPPTPGNAAPPTPRPIPPPGVAFQAAPLTLSSYQEPKCTTLTWNVVNAASVALDGQDVRPADSAQRCPSVSTTYTLLVRGHDGRVVNYPVTVTVIPDTAPPTIIRSDAVETRGGVAVTVEARDAESGLERIDIRVNDEPVGSCPVSPCSVVAGPLDEGSNTYTVEAYDRAGNRATFRATFTVGPPARPAPDLIVGRFVLQGTPDPTRDSVLVPVRVVVTNQGSVEAPPFKVAVSASDGSDSIFLYARASLAPQASITFDATIRVRRPAQGERIVLRATADSCIGDKGLPDYCRVDEGQNEGNNSATLAWMEASGGSPNPTVASEPQSPTDTPVATPVDTPGPTPSTEPGLPAPTDTPVPVPTERPPSPVPIETSIPALTETPAPLPTQAPATPVPTAGAGFGR